MTDPELDIHLDKNISDYSPAFRDFYSNYFVDTMGLTRGEVNVREFLDKLTEEEKELACDLLRRNLHLRYYHLIEGLGHLRDKKAIDPLDKLLTQETKYEWQLIISATLWKINQDKRYFDFIRQLSTRGSATMKWIYMGHVLNLPNEEAISILIGFLPDSDALVNSNALRLLNAIEFGRSKSYDKIVHDSVHYNNHRQDILFITEMADKLTSFKNTSH